MMSMIEVEKRLWETADQLRANSGLRPSEYSRAVLGLLFLKFADTRYAMVEEKLKPKPGSRINPGRDEFIANGAIYLTPQSRFEWLNQLPEDADLGKELNAAMEQIERDNPDLSEEERELVKKVAGDVLHQVKAEVEALDWQLREKARAAVRTKIREALDGLPAAYEEGIWNRKVERTYDWIMQSAGDAARH